MFILQNKLLQKLVDNGLNLHLVNLGPVAKIVKLCMCPFPSTGSDHSSVVKPVLLILAVLGCLIKTLAAHVLRNEIC